MAFLQAQAVIPYVTNVPKDVITNTFHFQSDGSTTNAAAAALIATRLSAFYDEVYSVTGSADTYVNWANAQVKVYDLDDLQPRVPITEAMPITPTSQADGVLPAEVAIVASFHAAPPVTARRRNRVYLGGWSTLAGSTGTGSNPPAPNSATRSAIIDAMELLYAANTTALTWQGHSSYGPSPVGTYWDIDGGWVDNAWDTQRRRGHEASIRDVWSA